MTAEQNIQNTRHGAGTLLRVAVLASLLALAGCQQSGVPAAADADGSAAATDARWAADHHMHIFSDDVSRLVTHMCERLGCPEGFPTGATDVPSAIAALDAAGIRQGTLLSVAYLFGAPEADDVIDDVAAAIRAENAATLARADTSCGRLVPFIGIDPLEDSALDEIAHWGDDPRVAGVKLHMAANDVDLRDDAQVSRLAAVFAKAAEHGLAVVIHLHNRNRSFGQTEVQNFLTRVLPSANGLPVQIAHVSGPGGAGGNVAAALSTFASVLRERPELSENLYFDLAAVPDVNMGALIETADEASLLRLRELIDEVGPEHFLLASDWVGVPELEAHYASMRERLALAPAQWEALVARGAPYLKAMPQARCGS